MKSREKELVSNSFILTIGNVLPKFSAFITLPILTAALSKAEYGQYDLITVSMSLLLPLITLLIEQGVFRFLLDSSDIKIRKKLISNSFIYVLISSIFLCLLSLVVLSEFHISMRILISLYLIFNLYYKYLIQICRGLRLLKVYSLSSMIQSFINVLLILVLVGFFKIGFYGLMLSLVISTLISNIYIAIKCDFIKYISFNLYDKKILKKLFDYSVPMIPNSISWWIIGVSDRWIITAVLGIEMNAIYAVSNKIPNLFNSLYNNFNLAWQESATSNNQNLDVDLYYSNIFKYLFDFLAGLLSILIAISPIIFNLLVNDSYKSAYYQMPILFLAMFFSSLSAYYGGIYIALKKTKSIGFSSFLAAIFNILINLIFISNFGLYAASFSTLISYIVLTVYRAKDINKYITINYNLKKIIIVLFIVIIMLVFNYNNNNVYNIINIIIAIIITPILNRNIIRKILLKFKKIK